MVMRLSRRRALRFALLLTPLFVGFLALYPWVIRAYHPAVIGAANLILSRMDPPLRIEIEKSGQWLALDIDRGYTRYFWGWQAWVKHLYFLSVALLPALLLATPAPLAQRLRLLAIAIPLQFGVHVLAIAGMMRAQYCIVLDPSDLFCHVELRIFHTSGQLFGAALWALLTWRYWFPHRAA